MHTSRLRCYLAGGRPPGASRTYPGCRDPRMPLRSVAVDLPGSVYFATESPVWTGGRAFYDPDAPGRVLARAHLVTTAQFADIAAQEMYAPPGHDLDLTQVLTEGRARLGPGRYETLVRPGELDGFPVLTFTAPWLMGDVKWTQPSAGYLRHLAAGLLEAGAWDLASVAAYLADLPGAAGHWTAAEVRLLVAD
ncbi:histone deacetylase [Actinacidiphila sp. ITFR-21]|uniref:histone deacetylase n=1 Tax=Actinacidiphila sp. ITFR-21 TaxID=3075199 RepID=UPI0028895DE5|nr:histone deacetylase [Streptomyces sp. ITFR-21]WNI19666.1 histone deacetylase [Streptomyces sp. ITFR-21]